MKKAIWAISSAAFMISSMPAAAKVADESHIFVTAIVCAANLPRYNKNKNTLLTVAFNRVGEGFKTADMHPTVQGSTLSLDLRAVPGYYNLALVGEYGTADTRVIVLPTRNRHVFMRICNSPSVYDSRRNLVVLLPNVPLNAELNFPSERTQLPTGLVDDNVLYADLLPSGPVELQITGNAGKRVCKIKLLDTSTLRSKKFGYRTYVLTLSELSEINNDGYCHDLDPLP